MNQKKGRGPSLEEWFLGVNAAGVCFLKRGSESL